MFLWRVYQLILAFIGGSIIIFIGQETGGEPPNPFIVAANGFCLAYGGSVGLARLIDRWRLRQRSKAGF